MLEKIKNILKKEKDVLFGYVFGSFCSKNFHNKSDIDIALYFSKTKNNTDTYLQIIHILEKNLKREIDLTILNSAKNIYLLDEIINKGIVVKDSSERFDFEIRKWQEINDFKYTTKMIENAA